MRRNHTVGQILLYLLSGVVRVARGASDGGVQREFRQKYSINVAKMGQNQILALLLCMFYSGIRAYSYLVTNMN